MTNSQIWLSQILSHWEDLFQEVEYKDIPMEYVDRLVIHLKDGKSIDVNVKELVEQNNLNYSRLERSLDEKLDKIEGKIRFVDWHIDVGKTADVVSEATEQTLGKINNG